MSRNNDECAYPTFIGYAFHELYSETVDEVRRWKQALEEAENRLENLEKQKKILQKETNERIKHKDVDILRSIRNDPANWKRTLTDYEFDICQMGKKSKRLTHTQLEIVVDFALKHGMKCIRTQRWEEPPGAYCKDDYNFALASVLFRKEIDTETEPSLREGHEFAETHMKELEQSLLSEENTENDESDDDDDDDQPKKRRRLYSGITSDFCDTSTRIFRVYTQRQH